MNNIYYIIIGMMVVTYIPRLLPFLFLEKIKLPPKVHRVLTFIPYTALGALIIPGIFTATPSMPIASLLGGAFALVYSWNKGGIIIPVIGAILTTFLVLLI
ncbi:Branched-chain amino acid transport protein [Desulfonispora thiosulfatigenes DSM 11270]|uniref:Branched-chain amino acid transport protein n=1 Tax=Desulfonispora thiosulfatigenes DSM 11270 TaxID=656914 RepID=A0A1W1VDF0_DESTI|nr:AzlD domain-containing protein [Desulfonispora thiosulfatigenes]SMB91071.1 Branched-chain amino acid transport protein [Desulfonispora thiosulfatigenes DSM 11270]